MKISNKKNYLRNIRIILYVLCIFLGGYLIAREIGNMYVTRHFLYGLILIFLGISLITWEIRAIYFATKKSKNKSLPLSPASIEAMKILAKKTEAAKKESEELIKKFIDSIN